MKNLTFYKSQHKVGFINQKVLATEWRWRLRANNGRIIGASTQGYRRRIDCVYNADQVEGLLAAESWKRDIEGMENEK